ncbi:NUDIX domain-containing protein [Candidatus Saccharibacteria bacterium]|nr:NUDIX domain-containing protein [Candidatus Saccharibacteria bacterium]
MNDGMIDVLDQWGDKTGEILPKTEVHKRELWHAGAHLWIYNSKGEVLLQHRSPGKKIFPDTWDISVAGHVDSGETPPQTLVREAKEELDLTIDPELLRFIGITFFDAKLPVGWIHRVFDWTYILQMEIDLKSLKFQETEVDDIKWHPMDDFERDINSPEIFKRYSARPKYVYQMAITEIQDMLIKNQSE